MNTLRSVKAVLMQIDHTTLGARPVYDGPSWCASTEPRGGQPPRRPTDWPRLRVSRFAQFEVTPAL